MCAAAIFWTYATWLSSSGPWMGGSAHVQATAATTASAMIAPRGAGTRRAPVRTGGRARAATAVGVGV